MGQINILQGHAIGVVGLGMQLGLVPRKSTSMGSAKVEIQDLEKNLSEDPGPMIRTKVV